MKNNITSLHKYLTHNDSFVRYFAKSALEFKGENYIIESYEGNGEGLKENT